MNAIALYQYLTSQDLVPAKMYRGDYLLDLRQNLYYRGRLLATQVSYITDSLFVRGKRVFELANPQKCICRLEHLPVSFFVFENKDCAILRDGSFVYLHSGRELLTLSQAPASHYGKGKRTIMVRAEPSVPTAIEYASEFSYHGVFQADFSNVRKIGDVLHQAYEFFEYGHIWPAKLMLFALCTALGAGVYNELDAHFTHIGRHNVYCNALLDTLLFLVEFNGYVYFYENN